MSSAPDPADAEQALAIARQQRRRVLDASREPWWAWLAVLVLVFLVSAVRDFGPQARSWTLTLMILLVLAWTYLPRLSPRIATAIGQGVRPRRGLLPLHTRLALFGASLAGAAVATAVGGLAAGYLDRLGAPGWVSRYPHTATGVVTAVLVTAIAIAVDRSVRSRSAR